MDHTKRVLVLAVVVVLAGCGGGSGPAEPETPTPEGDRDREFTLSVSGTTTYHIDVRLLSTRPSDINVTSVNGTTRTVAIPDTSGHFRPVDEPLTGVEVRDAVERVSVTDPGNLSVDVDDIPSTPTVVYTVREPTTSGSESRLVRWGVVNCGRHVSTLRLRFGNGGGFGFDCTV